MILQRSYCPLFSSYVLDVSYQNAVVIFPVRALLKNKTIYRMKIYINYISIIIYWLIKNIYIHLKYEYKKVYFILWLVYTEYQNTIHQGINNVLLCFRNRVRCILPFVISGCFFLNILGSKRLTAFIKDILTFEKDVNANKLIF